MRGKGVRVEPLDEDAESSGVGFFESNDSGLLVRISEIRDEEVGGVGKEILVDVPLLFAFAYH